MNIETLRLLFDILDIALAFILIPITKFLFNLKIDFEKTKTQIDEHFKRQEQEMKELKEILKLFTHNLIKGE